MSVMEHCVGVMTVAPVEEGTDEVMLVAPILLCITMAHIPHIIGQCDTHWNPPGRLAVDLTGWVVREI
ncbi:hypothetical protein E2C01_019158 [Portunus trituberculatus]|uniref:Uncharacterized protein n=1 Tax=Portunus trituberculatus TaxID=210409 RepID=A0A5B7DY38_PORTR|nr:hypothetical protein [Portunus trituberculatus]